MADEPTLFGDAYPRQPVYPAWFKLSGSARQRGHVASGLHPTGHKLAEEGTGTCGDCSHRVRVGNVNTYQKCGLDPRTHGPGTDIRAKWPACVRYESKV